jgi:hypothetical protein
MDEVEGALDRDLAVRARGKGGGGLSGAWEGKNSAGR